MTTATNTNTCNSPHRSTTNPLTKRPTSRDALRKGHPLSQTDQPKVVPDRAMYCRKIIPFAARQRHRAYKHQRGRWLAVTTRTRNTTTGLDRCTVQSATKFYARSMRISSSRAAPPSATAQTGIHAMWMYTHTGNAIDGQRPPK